MFSFREKHRLLLIVLLSLLTLTPPEYFAFAAATNEPILRIETGMHTAALTGMDADVNGRFIVTGAEDKTARVWDAASGQLLQVLRPPIDIEPSWNGAINAVAISPDGATVASAVRARGQGGAVALYLFERASGRILHRLGDAAIVEHLAFSPDGRFLAVGMAGSGLRVYRLADGATVADYEDNAAKHVDFSADGRLVTAGWYVAEDDKAYDYISLYDKDFKLIRQQKTTEGRWPVFARFSPDGSRIALGYGRSIAPRIVSGRDLSPLYDVALKKEDARQIKLDWSPDGRFLYGAGDIRHDDALAELRWNDGGRGAATIIGTQAAGNRRTGALKVLRDGGLAFSSDSISRPAIGALNADGKPRFLHDSATLGFAYEQPLLVRDGSAVQFTPDDYSFKPMRFSLAERSLLAGVADSAGLRAPLTDISGLAKPADSTDKLEDVVISPDRSSYLLSHKRLYDRAGKERWNINRTVLAQAANITDNNRLAVIAWSDGTIRWYRTSDAKELLAFFPHADKKRWVAWTPSGYYDASPGGEDLIGWHLNNANDKAADFFPASRFRERFYRPDVVQRVLSALDEVEAVRLANAEANRKEEPKVEIAQVLPPVVTILSPQNGAVVSANEVTIEYSVRVPSGDEVRSVRALVDGRPAAVNRDLQKVAVGEAARRTITVPMPPRECEVSIIAENQNGTSKAANVRLAWRGASPAEFTVKPKLYVLAIGISQYANPQNNLTYAAKDARDFAAACAAQKGALYREVESKILTDEDATRDNIADGLEWIERQTTARDVAMVFLSGHGINAASGDYYFVPHNFHPDSLKRTGVVFTDIRNTIANIAGKALFFVDSCHSGNVMGTGRSKSMTDINAVINELSAAENGAVVFSASTGKQLSWEDPAWSNGAFTRALVEGIGGKAQFNGRVTVKSLDFYISERVKELTQGRQTPTTQIPPAVPDFPVAVVQ